MRIVICAVLLSGCTTPREHPVPDTSNWQWDGDIYDGIEFAPARGL